MKNPSKIRTILALVVLLTAIVLPVVHTRAAALNQTSVSLGRLAVNANSSEVFVSIKFNTTASVDGVKLTFPAGFTVAGAGWSVVTTGRPNTPTTTALPGTLTVTPSGQTVQIGGVSGINNTTLYGVRLTGTNIVTNPASGGQKSITVQSTNAGAAVDTSTVPVYIVNGTSEYDQVTVNATVATNVSFSLSANSDSVSVDQTSIGTSSGVNMLVSTNSSLGYTAYVKSAGAKLHSTTTTQDINTGTFNGSPDTVTAGSSLYTFVPSTGAACSTCTGSISYDGEYAGLTGTTGGSFNSTNFASFVSRNGYTNTDTFSLKERVAVAASIGAASDYTDTLTVVAAGNF